MPGIAGIIGKSCSRAEQSTNDIEKIILEMTQSMKHEDFYSLETYRDENVALGITSIEQSATCFTFNEKRTLLGLVSGKIFGKELISCLHLYERNGMKFLSETKGEFVLLIYDIKEGKLSLVSDRCGFKPLYYMELRGKFIFASELKAILEYPEVKREIDLSGVAEYALFNYPLGEHTFVKNIRRFPPGEIWEFDVRATSQLRFHKKKYWEIGELLKEKTLPAREGLKQSGEVFNKIVGDLTKEESKVGLTLSAGYDSRVILSALKSSQIRALTFGKRTDREVIVASKLAKLVGCKHLIQEFEENFTDRIMDFLYQTVRITDGLCNITHSWLLYVFNLQREFINPCFVGFGGSELIRGLQNTALSFSPNSKKLLLSCNLQLATNIQYLGFFSPELLKNANDERFTTHDSRFTIRERALFFTLEEIMRKYYGADIALMESQVQVRIPYMDYDFLKFILRTPFSILHTAPFSRNPFERLKGQKLSASIIKYNEPKLLEVPTDRGYLPRWNISSFGLPVIFWHQIRRRLFVEAIHELPLLRLSVKQILEEIVGVGLKPAITERDYYNIAKIKEAVEQYPNWSLQEWCELSKIVTFELWLRQFID
ncbi:MAG: hypothetical protein COT09_05680 [Candidatus Hydromicrobium americanum]|nr:MAG: hypothetical protein COT09_05680 [Candidatus Hydromicrobium americanum]